MAPNLEQMKFDNLINFKLSNKNEKKLKIFYTKCSGIRNSRLKVKILTLLSYDKDNKCTRDKDDGDINSNYNQFSEEQQEQQLISILEKAALINSNSHNQQNNNQHDNHDYNQHLENSSHNNQPAQDKQPKHNNNNENFKSSKKIQSNKIRLSESSFARLTKQLDEQLSNLRNKRPQRLLIFANPYGGKGKALQVFQGTVEPLLKLAQCEYKLVVTKYANHAREILEDPTSFESSHYDGVIGIGGDGLFSELMNGLLFRSYKKQQQRIANSNNNDNDTSSDNESSVSKGASKFCSPSIPLGIISAGSTDANSFGFIGTNDVITATLNIILGNQISVDVCSLHEYESDKLLRFASTFAAYGYFGDIVRESEKLRWLGPSRYDITGINNLLKNRSYEGHLRILVSDSDGSPSDQDRCHRDCKVCQSQSEINITTHQQELETAEQGLKNQETHHHDNNKNQQQEEKLIAIELEGPFVGVNAAITACRCPQTRKGFSPANHLGNGCADLIVIKPCSRLQYLRYLLRTGWTKKSPFELKYVEAFRCREFEFIAHRSSTASSWNVDGEVLNEYSIRVRVNNQLLRVFGTGEPEPIIKS